MFCHLFKLLFDVCVCLQFELSASVGPVNQEESLLRVHLLDQYGSFLVVPHLLHIIEVAAAIPSKFQINYSKPPFKITSG